MNHEEISKTIKSIQRGLEYLTQYMNAIGVQLEKLQGNRGADLLALINDNIGSRSTDIMDGDLLKAQHVRDATAQYLKLLLVEYTRLYNEKVKELNQFTSKARLENLYNKEDTNE